MRTVRRGLPMAAGGSAAGVGWWIARHRAAAAVAAWAPGAGRRLRAGPLSVRVLGSRGPVVLLLHGMIAAGNSFGATYDLLAENATLVVPDLLGFGSSVGSTRPTDATAHLQALDAALADLGLDREPIVVAGHSMGGTLALRWAGSHPDRVIGAVTFGAPLYRNRAEADEHVAAMGRMEALLATDGWLPRTVCGWMCRHRGLASWIAVAMRPDLPVAVARSGVKHTWATYTGSMNGLIRDPGWAAAVQRLNHAGIPVTLVAGARDPVPVAGRAAELARDCPSVRTAVHPSAAHGLPLTNPDWCARLIAGATHGGGRVPPS